MPNFWVWRGLVYLNHSIYNFVHKVIHLFSKKFGSLYHLNLSPPKNLVIKIRASKGLRCSWLFSHIIFSAGQTISKVLYIGVSMRNFGGFNVMAGLVGGPGEGRAPRTTENFRKFSKIFLKKIARNALFWPIFQRKLKNLALNFRVFGQ